MKNITSKIVQAVTLLLFVQIFSIAAFANSDPMGSDKAILNKTIDKTLKINVPANMDTYVLVTDELGNTVYANSFSKDYYAGKVFNFSGIENGIYTFVKETDQKMIEKTILIDNSGLKVVEEESNYYPVFDIKDNVLKVSYLNLDENDISIVLEDVMYTYLDEFVGNDVSLGKMFDIAKLPMGEFSLTLTAGEDTYNYYFRK